MSQEGTIIEMLNEGGKKLYYFFSKVAYFAIHNR